jgi:hypothetical protein
MPYPLHFTLYSRSYCHLCDDMLQALRSFDATGKFTIDVIDIDADPELIARYDELVPVLMGHREDESSMQICHYFLDLAALQAYLDNGNPTTLSGP